MNSSLWNIPRRLFPAAGILSALCALSVLGVQTVRAQTVDIARARAWLTERVPAMLADTTTPIRVLATTAQALTDTNLTAQLRTAILARQRPDGFFTEPGTADALYDQTLVCVILRGSQEGGLAARALLACQHADGGWSSSLGTVEHADAVSTADAIPSLQLNGRKLQELAGLNDDALLQIIQRALKFLASLQDENTGLIGYETSSYGSWGPTAASLWPLICFDRRGLATRRAFTALSTPDLKSYPARNASREVMFAISAAAFLPQSATRTYFESLVSELAGHQQPDGFWPAIKPQTNEVLSTAQATMLAQVIGDGNPPAPEWIRGIFRSLKTEPVLSAQLLLTLPAETADLLHIAPEQITQTNFVALCNQATLMTALAHRFTNPETKHFTTLGWKLADIAKAAHAGPITFDRIANHIADEKKIQLTYVLGTDDLTAALDTLTDKQLARALDELEKIDVREHLNNARNAWACNDRATLEKEIAILSPATLKPFLEKLATLSAERIRTQLKKNPDTLLILDAFLAHGILAQLAEK